MRIGVLVVLVLAVKAGALAQAGASEQLVLEPITRLFAGMNKGDSALVHSAFAKEITMATVAKDKAGNTIVRRESSLAAFLKAVGTPHTEPWSEPIWNTKVEVDGNFAQVWTEYAFYVGKKFSHCGVDAFQLVHEGAGWKIIHLADTRRTQDCKVPPHIADQFK
ncbi:MAG: nuclear transport factor 2 family protein [Cyclobacteriaceae bacterium]|nr:nuclear transport factor 2 family protein [Cytophagales bacterium]MBX2898596.1 nuclear transport factor 2 family protein [Cyclobacteriaceae bacterium]